MDQHSQELENLFRKLSEQQKLNPSASVLRKLKFRLWMSDFFSLNLRKVNFLYTIAFIGGVTSCILLLQKPDTEKTLLNNKASINSQKNITELPLQSDTKTGKLVVQKEKSTEESHEAMLMARFEVESSRGCAPFHVRFSDKSVLADQWYWDFGNGDYSEKQDPEYTYRNPGLYRAALKIKDNKGREAVYYQDIEVLKKPLASLEIDKDNSLIHEHKIVFKNESEGAVSYSWDFGDNKQSEVQQPSHVYDDFGVYKVKLIAKASNGCRDTAVLMNKFLDQDYELSFPQNFKPNPFDRSNNGFYEKAGMEAFIFFPVNRGAREYNLTIYTANGTKVFETDNIKQGWNGYFGGSLAPGGFYTYVAKGVYPNGKSFEIKGMVKVIIDDYYYKF